MAMVENLRAKVNGNAHGLDLDFGFLAAANAAGLRIDRLKADGRIHRCPTDTHPKSKNGAYKLSPEEGGGWFKDWASGAKAQAWFIQDGDNSLTEGEKLELKRKRAAARKEADEAQKAAQAIAAEKAAQRWEAAQLADGHQYLDDKGIAAHGARIDGAALLIPVRAADGRMMSLQRIFPNGKKFFEQDGALSGGMFVIGEIDPDGVFLLGEGYSTMATCHEATDLPAVVAFNSSNVPKVAKVLRAMYPRARICVCADDDHETRDAAGKLTNPGMRDATTAARLAGAALAVPTVGAGKSDFNDMAAELGIDEVENAISDALGTAKEAPVSEPAGNKVIKINGIKTNQKKDPLDMRGPTDRPTVYVRAGEVHTVTDEAMKILIESGAKIFQRGKGLVRPIRVEGNDSKGRTVYSACLIDVEKEWLRKVLCLFAHWYKQDTRVKVGWRKIDAPEDIAMSILKSKGEWSFRAISGVISTPTLRYDGSILEKQGFDNMTHLYLDSAVKLPPIPDAPTRADAEDALKLLNGLLEEFPFVNRASKSVALSAMLSAVARGMVDVVPGHGSRAPTAGTGKSYLFDIVSAIIMGERCPVISASEDNDGETEKRIIGMAMSGQPIINIDNVNGTLGGDALCQLIERPICNLRALGKSDPVRVENRSLVFFTGNNVRVKGDMTRRVVVADLDARMEKPAEREFKSDPVAAVLANRGEYISACMIIIRAFIKAGSPKQAFKPMNSFGEWSGTIRSALVWLGEADPCETVKKARDEDPELQKLANFVTAAKEFIGGEHMALQLRELIKLGMEERSTGSGWEPKHPDLNGFISDFKGRGGFDSSRFGNWLKKFKGRVVDGCCINSVTDTHKKVEKWYIEDMAV